MKKQLRFKKEAGRLLNQELVVRSAVTMNEFLACISIDDTPKYIQLLDEYAEDLGITEECFIYFAEQILLEYKNMDLNDREEKVMKILKKLNKLI